VMTLADGSGRRCNDTLISLCSPELQPVFGVADGANVGFFVPALILTPCAMPVAVAFQVSG